VGRFVDVERSGGEVTQQCDPALSSLHKAEQCLVLFLASCYSYHLVRDADLSKV